MKKSSVIGLFFKEKPYLILLEIYKNENEAYPSNIAKKVDCTYSHAVKVLDLFKKEGLIDFKKEGRTKRIILTNKGKKLAEYFRNIIKKLE